MTTPEQLPDDPTSTPSVARMYDYYLGGHHNFPADRAAAEQIIALHPETPLMAQANRAFLRRAVTFLVRHGIDQFLDLGSGIPTVGNVHEVAQGLNPTARVVYVDIDPVAVTYSSSLLAGNANATVVQVDARDPSTLLNHPEVRRLLDFSRPVAVLMLAFLHFLTDDAEAEGLVRSLRDTLAAGSYLVMSHGAVEVFPRDIVESSAEVYRRSTNPFRFRTRDQIAAFFEGLDLIEPGIVPAPLWHPEGQDDVFLSEPARAGTLAAVGRKP